MGQCERNPRKRTHHECEKKKREEEKSKNLNNKRLVSAIITTMLLFSTTLQSEIIPTISKAQTTQSLVLEAWEGQLAKYDIVVSWQPPHPERQICVWAEGLPLFAIFEPAYGFGSVNGTLEIAPRIGDAGSYNCTFYSGEILGVPLKAYPSIIIVHEVPLTPPDEILIEDIIAPENLTYDLIAYKLPKPLQTGDVITPCGLHESSHEYVVNGTKWFYWINDCPYALFAHDTRYVLIDGYTGKYDVWSERWQPALNGKQLWATPEEYWNTTNWIYSTAANSSQFSATKSTNILASEIQSNVPSIRDVGSQSAKRALIIEGNDSTRCLKDAAELSYDLMINFGYLDQEITYLNPRNQTSSASTRENVFNAVKNISDTLNTGDTLTLFIFAHGDIEYEENLTGYVQLKDFVPLYDYELKQSLSQMKDGVHVDIIIDSCFSGSLMDDLWSLKNVEIIITSTDWKSESYMASLDPPENWLFVANLTSDPNTWDEGVEFSSGLMEGLNELRQSVVNGSITIGELYVKAFNKAKDLDAGFINGEKLAESSGKREREPAPLMTTVFFKGDINHDGIVDILDISKAAIAVYCTPGDLMWDPEADLDKSASIDIVDISKIAVEFDTVYFTDDAHAGY